MDSTMYIVWIRNTNSLVWNRWAATLEMALMAVTRIMYNWSRTMYNLGGGGGYNNFNNLVLLPRWWLRNLILRYIYRKVFFRFLMVRNPPQILCFFIPIWMFTKTLFGSNSHFFENFEDKCSRNCSKNDKQLWWICLRITLGILFRGAHFFVKKDQNRCTLHNLHARWVTSV